MFHEGRINSDTKQRRLYAMYIYSIIKSGYIAGHHETATVFPGSFFCLIAPIRIPNIFIEDRILVGSKSARKNHIARYRDSGTFDNFSIFKY